MLLCISSAFHDSDAINFTVTQRGEASGAKPPGRTAIRSPRTVSFSLCRLLLIHRNLITWIHLFVLDNIQTTSHIMPDTQTLHPEIAYAERSSATDEEKVGSCHHDLITRLIEGASADRLSLTPIVEYHLLHDQCTRYRR